MYILIMHWWWSEVIDPEWKRVIYVFGERMRYSMLVDGERERRWSRGEWRCDESHSGRGDKSYVSWEIRIQCVGYLRG